jgi:hypothetical protein
MSEPSDYGAKFFMVEDKHRVASYYYADRIDVSTCGCLCLFSRFKRKGDEYPMVIFAPFQWVKVSGVSILSGGEVSLADVVDIEEAPND